MLYGYFTVSGGREDSAICSLCGFVAEADVWDDVDHAWRKLLADSGGGFDAIGCLHGTGVYQSWDLLQRHALLADLSGALVRSALAPVGAFVIQQDFWMLSPADRVVLATENVDSPLDLMFSNLMERMICLVYEESEKISLVMAQEPESADRYNALFNKHVGRYLLGPHLMGALAFLSAEGSMHLQAAKLLAEALLLIEKRTAFPRETDIPFVLPPGLQQLGEQIHQQGRFDAAKLEGLIARLKTPAGNPDH